MINTKGQRRHSCTGRASPTAVLPERGSAHAINHSHDELRRLPGEQRAGAGAAGIPAGRGGRGSPDQAVSSVLGTLFRQKEERGPGGPCAPRAGTRLPRGLGSALGTPAVLGKNPNPPPQGRAVTGLRRKLPVVAYYCRLDTYRDLLWHPCGEICAFPGTNRPSAGCSVPCGEEQRHRRAPPGSAGLGAVNTAALLSFLGGSSPVIFHQHSSKSLKINESLGLRLFSLSVTGTRCLPACNEKSQTIHPFDLVLLPQADKGGPPVLGGFAFLCVQRGRVLRIKVKS